MSENKQQRNIVEVIHTTLDQSGFYGDFATLLALGIGAISSWLSAHFIKFLKLKKKTTTLDDDIKYILHTILGQSQADGLMLGFPTTRNNLRKSPTHSLVWDFKINRPNIILSPPKLSPSEYSTNASKDWVLIDSVFGVYYYKTFYQEGLILAYLLVYDTSSIDPANLQNIDTKTLRKYLTLYTQET